jgi:hypothetical protein
MATKIPKPLVAPWPAKKECDKEASARGEKILSSKAGTILVRHKRKKWCMLELLQHLASRVAELEKSQCVPGIKCLFEGRNYLDDKYIRKPKYEQPIIYDE